MNFGYALGKGLEAGANAGAQVMDNTMREQAEVRAADRRLADQERLMAAQEMMAIRAGERAQAFKIGDETRADARLTDADRAKKIAQAGEAAAGVKAQGEIDRTVELAGNQSYLNAARKLKQNEQITSPAQALALEAAKLDLEQRKTLLVKQDALRNAMQTGDKAEQERLVKEIAVLNGKGIDPSGKDFTDREKALAHALEATLRDPDAAPEEKAQARRDLMTLTAPKGGEAAGGNTLDAQLRAQIAAAAAAKKGAPPPPPATQPPAAPSVEKPLLQKARESAADESLYERSGQAAKGAAADKAAAERAQRKAAAEADPDIIALRQKRAQVARSGDPREGNKIVSQIEQILKQRYDL